MANRIIMFRSLKCATKKNSVCYGEKTRCLSYRRGYYPIYLISLIRLGGLD